MAAQAGADPLGANAREAVAMELLQQGGGKSRVSESSRLMVPYFRVDTLNPSGDTTLFAVRNESLSMVTLTIDYYEVDSPQAPQRTDTVMLAAKSVHPVNIRDVQNLEVDESGLAEGYVIVTASGVEDPSVLSGDFFNVTPGEAFATGERMLDVDPASTNNALCSVFSTRFLSGAGFSGGTNITFWFEADSLPVDPFLFAYTIYNESGAVVFSSNLPVEQVAGSVSIEQLLGPFSASAGAIEIQFTNTVGYVAATMSAAGTYSIGLDGVCKD